ncbi:MAG TPA: type II CAAX endopeptidase family protein [Casimicrobiaceae bacterium]
MTRRPAFWVVYALVSLAALALALALFPRAIPIVSLDITLSRSDAVARARAIAAKYSLAPADARAAVRFAHDSTTQNYVELEGGGKPAFARLTRGDVYAPYWWEVRLFRLGAIDETVIRLAPDGRLDGFSRRVPETWVHDPARKALGEAEARTIAETTAARDWGVDPSRYRFLEHSQQTEPGGRVDHRFTYERPEALGDARVRLRLTVAGDELIGVTPFVHVPESFTRRYAELRSANDLVAHLADIAAGVLYGIGGCVLAVLWLARRRALVLRPALVAGLSIGALLAVASLAAAPVAWFGADTTQTAATFWTREIATALLIAIGGGLGYALAFLAAEGLSRSAFPRQPQLWRLWSRDAAASPQVLGRTLGGYLFVPIELALIAAFYYATNRWLGWWQPSEVLTDPSVLGSAVPAATPIALSLEAGFMEECVFRAIPLSLGALIGARFGRRGLGIAIAVVLQALIFGSAHANYPGFPAWSRPAELFVPAIVWALIFLRFGLLPTIVLHACFDLSLFSIPLFLVAARGAQLQQALVIAAAAVPLAVVLWRRVQNGAWRPLPDALTNGAWRAHPAAAESTPPTAALSAAGALSARFQRALPALGVAGLIAWAIATPFRADVPPLTLDRAGAIRAADAALAARGVTLTPDWHRYATPKLASADPQQWAWHRFVWDEAGRSTYRKLVGGILAPPVWEVRYARFDGDVTERAEEWHIGIDNDGSVRSFLHVLPEARPGASLTLDAARTLAARELGAQFGVDAAKLTPVAAEERQRPARVDWSFVWGDPGIDAGKGAEARYAIAIGGDRPTAAGRFVHLPETWLRSEQARDNWLQILELGTVAVFAAAALAALVVGIRSWIARRVDSRALKRAAAITFALVVLAGANGWPQVAMGLSTTDPVAAQVSIKVLAVLASALVAALVVGLCAGVGGFGARTLPPFAIRGRVPATAVAIAAGAFVVGLQAVLAALGGRDVPLWPDPEWRSAWSPWLGAALSGVAFLITASAELFVVHAASLLTRGWTRRVWLAVAIVVALECAFALAHGRSAPVASLATGLAGGIAAAAVVILFLRYDLRWVPAFAATVALLDGFARALRADALSWFVVDAAVTLFIAWRTTAWLHARWPAPAPVTLASAPATHPG